MIKACEVPMTTTDTSPLLVAVATKDGIGVNLHFGHARRFNIYEVDGSAVHFIEVRDADAYCKGKGEAGDEPEESREQELERIATTLGGVSALMVVRAGDNPKKRLGAAGIAVLDEFAHEPIEAAALVWWNRVNATA